MRDLPTIKISIPLPLQPVERGERFDLPLCDLFDELDGGDVVGGGTELKHGEVVGCDLEIEIESTTHISAVARVLDSGGAPHNTTLRIDDGEDIFLRDLLT